MAGFEYTWEGKTYRCSDVEDFIEILNEADDDDMGKLFATAFVREALKHSDFYTKLTNYGHENIAERLTKHRQAYMFEQHLKQPSNSHMQLQTHPHSFTTGNPVIDDGCFSLKCKIL